MTTGATIFLVSACASGEQFVAAFRRYADKNGLFIPIATPIPAGRRGRFAVTLTSGGVMIEGDADVVSSATTPSVLHGRVGMTLRFLDPDIKSKTVLVELEAARLAMKPQPPSVAPRPAGVPAEPRPVPPKPGGRIDANNALAECVAIGNVDGLEVGSSQKPPPKFVVPAIPPMSGRPKPPSVVIPPVAPIPKPPARPQTPSAPPMPPMPASTPRTGAALAASLQAAGSHTPSDPITPPEPPARPPASLQPRTPPPATNVRSALPATNVRSALPAANLRTPSEPLPAAGSSPPSAPNPTSAPPRPRTPSAEMTALGTGVAPTGSTSRAASANVRARSPSDEMTALGTGVAPAVLAAATDSPSNEMTAVAPIVSAPTTDPGMAVAAPRTTTKQGVIAAVSPRVAVAKSVTEGWDVAPDADAPASVDDVRDVRDTTAMPPMSADDLLEIPQARAAEVFGVVPDPDGGTHPAIELDGIPEAVPVLTEGKPNGNSGRAALPPPRRGQSPRGPTPSSPMPIVKAFKGPTTDEVEVPVAPAPMPELDAPNLDGDEATDITSVPILGREDSGVVRETPSRAREPSTPHAVVREASKPAVGVRKTVIGVAVVPEGITVLPAAPAQPAQQVSDTAVMDATRPTPPAAAAVSEPKITTPVVRPPVIEEPSGDWTMVPGDAGVTILPRTPGSDPKLPKVVIEDIDGEPEAPIRRAGVATPEDGNRLPTGDWTIARVEDSPDGWSEPSKIDLAPLPRQARLRTGPPVAVVSGEKPLEVTTTAKQFEIEEATKSGLKVEVDASLPTEVGGVDVSLASTQFAAPMATPVPGMLHASMAAPPMSAAPMQPIPMQPMQPMQVMPPGMPPHVMMQPVPGTPMPRGSSSPSTGTGSGSFPDYRRQITDAGTDFFRDSNQVMALPHDSQPSIPQRSERTRLVIIIASAAVVVTLGVMLVLALGGDDDAPPPPNQTSPSGQNRSAAPAPAPIDEPTPDGSQAPVIDAASEPSERADASSVPPTGCVVEVTSSPSGADILIDKAVLGTTPATLSLPCDTSATLVVKKSKYVTANKTITPTAAGMKIKVSLGKTTLSVKVTSSPPGASISVNGKSLGVTPAVVKLPANESSTLVLAKSGFSTETEKITPKQNNQSVHATLKKKR